MASGNPTPAGLLRAISTRETLEKSPEAGERVNMKRTVATDAELHLFGRLVPRPSVAPAGRAGWLAETAYEFCGWLDTNELEASTFKGEPIFTERNIAETRTAHAELDDLTLNDFKRLDGYKVIANALLASTQVGPATFLPPDEFGPTETFPEGAGSEVVVNRYERDPRARKACIDRWGHACAVCGFDFETRYGELGNGYIHVHHLADLSLVGDEYEVDPVEDLRPVCPNCHAMLHNHSRPARSIKELQARLIES